MGDTVLNLIKGENKYLKFTVTNKDTGVAVDCTATTCELTGGNISNPTAYSKANNDFDKGEAASGIIKVLTLFNVAGYFDFLLKVTFTGTGVIDEELFTVIVEDT